MKAMSLARNLWRDERGVVMSAELILMATICVIGIIVGLVTYRDQVVQELGDAAMAVSQLNQGYSYTTDLDPNTGGVQTTRTFDFGNVSVEVSVNNSQYVDNSDFCDSSNVNNPDGSGFANDPAGQAPACITIGDSAPANRNEGPAQNQPTP